MAKRQFPRYQCHHKQRGKGGLTVWECMRRQDAGLCPAKELGPCQWDWRYVAKWDNVDRWDRCQEESMVQAIGLDDYGDGGID